jgi:hypothetical protein
VKSGRNPRIQTRKLPGSGIATVGLKLLKARPTAGLVPVNVIRILSTPEGKLVKLKVQG